MKISQYSIFCGRLSYGFLILISLCIIGTYCIVARMCETDSDGAKHGVRPVPHSKNGRVVNKIEKALQRRVFARYFGATSSLADSQVKALKSQLMKQGDISGLAALFAITRDEQIKDILLSEPGCPAACQVLSLLGETPAERLEWARRYCDIRPDDRAGKIRLVGGLLDAGLKDDAYGMLPEICLDENIFLDALTYQQSAIWHSCGESIEEGNILAKSGSIAHMQIDLIARVATEYVNDSIVQSDGSPPSGPVLTANSLVSILSNSYNGGCSIETDRKILNLRRRILELNMQQTGFENADVLGEIERINKELTEIDGLDLKVARSLLNSDSGLIDEYMQVLDKNGYRIAARWLTGFDR